jgi:hypothetical protein
MEAAREEEEEEEEEEGIAIAIAIGRDRGRKAEKRRGREGMVPRKPSSRRLGGLVFLAVLLPISLVGAAALWSLTASPSCSFFSPALCRSPPWLSAPPPTLLPRHRTDGEIASLALTTHVLSSASSWTRTSPFPKLAFLFLTRGPLPHETLWELFFQVCSFSLSVSLSLSVVCRIAPVSPKCSRISSR